MFANRKRTHQLKVQCICRLLLENKDGPRVFSERDMFMSLCPFWFRSGLRRALAALVFLHALGGCATLLDMQTSGCLNPDSPLCTHPELDSRQLAVRVFQLRARQAAGCQSARLGGIPRPGGNSRGPQAALGGASGRPGTSGRKEEYFLRPSDSAAIDVKPVRGARYLLVVPRGRLRGEMVPMQLIDLGWFGFLGARTTCAFTDTTCTPTRALGRVDVIRRSLRWVWQSG